MLPAELLYPWACLTVLALLIWIIWTGVVTGTIKLMEESLRRL